jgi:hypothetical protein
MRAATLLLLCILLAKVNARAQASAFQATCPVSPLVHDTAPELRFVTRVKP